MHPLTRPEIELLIIASVAFAALLSNRIRPDLIAIITLLTLGIRKILPLDQTLAGFSRPAIITLVGLFVITATLERTGVVQWIADRLIRLSGSSEPRMVLVFMLAGALISLMMNNIAAGAMLLPAAVSISQRTGVRTSKVLMPLAFGTLLGGMATLFTTANIIISGNLQAQGLPPLTMLDFLPTGAAMVAVGVVYMLMIGRRLLPNRRSAIHQTIAAANLVETYQLEERLWEVRIQPDSPLINQSLGQTSIGANYGTTVVGIWHGSEARIPAAPTDVLAADDILLVLGNEERVRRLERLDTQIGRNGKYRSSAHDISVRLTEVVIAPRSSALGQTLKQMRFRTKFGITTIALWRNGRSYRTDVGNFVLQAGDALLMVGPPDRIRVLAEERGFIVLDHTPQSEIALPDKALLSAFIAALAVILAALTILPTAEAMLGGAALLVLTGCTSMDEAYRAIEWRVIVLIAGLLPIGTAVVVTGLAEQIGRFFTTHFSSTGPLVLIASLYLFTVLLTQLVGGQVAALIIGPIAASTAVQLGINSTAIGVAIAMACSVAFLTPIAHPVNVLMMEPGGYSFNDFLRVGAGLTVLCFLTLLLVMSLFWTL